MAAETYGPGRARRAQLCAAQPQPPAHWRLTGTSYLICQADGGLCVEIWLRRWPQLRTAPFARLCDALRWRRLALRAWDEALTPAEEQAVAAGWAGEGEPCAGG